MKCESGPLHGQCKYCRWALSIEAVWSCTKGVHSNGRGLLFGVCVYIFTWASPVNRLPLTVFWSSQQIGRAPVEVELSCWISVREAGDVHVRRQRQLHCGYKGKKSCISLLRSLARQKRSIVVNASMQPDAKSAWGNVSLSQKRQCPMSGPSFNVKLCFFLGLVCQAYKS